MIRTKEDAVKAIQKLDLSPIKNKLMLPSREREAWTQAQVDTVEKWYKRFLILHAKYPGEKKVPNGPIDTFWHYHILDTRKYAQDCETIFGEFLHHYPYFGLKGDSEARDKAFEKTNQYYRIEFGEDCTEMFKMKSSIKAGVKTTGVMNGMDCSDPCSTDEG